jgi:hypothetical protein
MDPSHDGLYQIHRHGAKMAGRTPLSYPQFRAKLEGRSDLNLSRLAPPPVLGTPMKTRFCLGAIDVTANAQEALLPTEIRNALMRHASGDWGELPSSDIGQNERALLKGGRLCSRFISARGAPFYVITEADRSVTTVLLPQDY